MKKVIRLTESDLRRIITNIIEEQIGVDENKLLAKFLTNFDCSGSGSGLMWKNTSNSRGYVPNKETLKNYPISFSTGCWSWGRPLSFFIIFLIRATSVMFFDEGCSFIGCL